MTRLDTVNKSSGNTCDLLLHITKVTPTAEARGG